MGSAAPVLEEIAPDADTKSDNEATNVSRERPSDGARDTSREIRAEANADSLRDAVLNALADQQMLVSILENAEWTLDGSTLFAKVAASGTMIEMSFTSDARRIAGAAASGVAGRPIKMLVEPGAAEQPASAPRKSPPNGSARSRAEQDPIVQRMKEKFGAEIRTVIDYREKG
jgi:DNA polymerase III subunit gamma/tau